MLSKTRTSVKLLYASITNPKPVSPINLQKKVDKIFLPTFESLASILFWLVSAVFLTGYAVAVQINTMTDIYQLCSLFIYHFTHNILIICFNIGFAFISIQQLKHKTHQQVAIQIILNSFVLTPIAVFFANLLLTILIDRDFLWENVVIYAVMATITINMVFGCLIYYFSNYQKKIEAQYQQYQQALIEQNEQIKARITPHFFFNMLNTVQYLIEKDPYEAENMLRSVSNLYRMSFNGNQEIGFLDEIEICKYYLSIERYRFADKLQVEWQLPDEDMLYDMTIASLTLQLVIEKMIIFVVENHTNPTKIAITVHWQNNKVTIQVQASVLGGFLTKAKQEIKQKLSFNHQAEILQEHYGKQANIHYQFEQQVLTTQIEYPLFDVAI